MLHPSAYLEFRQWHQEKLGRTPSAPRLLGHWLSQLFGQPPIAPVKLAGLRHPVYLRPWSSDLYVFEQIFIDREYDTPLQRPATILDAGANIGLAAVYFANRFPDSRIVALEPDGENFALLQLNAKRYPNIQCLHAGLWSRRAQLQLANAGEKSWALRFTASDGEREASGTGEAPSIQEASSVSAMSIDEVSEVGLSGVPFDLVKIDIEGAEQEVFAAGGRWLEQAQSIIVECHDRLVPGCEATVLQAASHQKFTPRRSGEYLVLQRPAAGPVRHG